ncbi:MAG: OmpH family outer membrane protein [Proteobacteria bacterium]|nr:OmpH family outer membrane protein [Pseudomonadota bacterium]
MFCVKRNYGTMWAYWLMLLLTALITTDARADDVAILVIDPKAVVEQSKAFQSIQQQIADKNADYKKKSNTQQDTLKSAYHALEEQKSTIPQQEYEQRSRKLIEQAKDYNKEAHANKAMLDNALSKATGQIDQVIEGIMANYVHSLGSKEKNRKILVLNKLNVIYASNSMDITDKVRKELDDRLPKVQVQFVRVNSETRVEQR